MMIEKKDKEIMLEMRQDSSWLAIAEKFSRKYGINKKDKKNLRKFANRIAQMSKRKQKPPVEVPAEMFAVEEIRGRSIINNKNVFLIKWTGYDDTQNSHVTEKLLREQCSEMVDEYLEEKHF